MLCFLIIYTIAKVDKWHHHGFGLRARPWISYQGCICEISTGGVGLLPSLPFPSLPIEVGPLNPARGSGGAPIGVWGGAPVEIKFGAFSHKIRHLVATIGMIFLRVNCPA